MPVLRLTRTAADEDAGDRIEIVFESAGTRRSAVVTLPPELAAQDEEDLRWYLEDYLEWPEEPAPTIAAQVEARLEALGTELFRHLFEGGLEARELWRALRPELAATRVQVAVPEERRVPWELVRDPVTRRPLAVDARSFVRRPAGSRSVLPAAAELPLRVLVVICRPGGGSDVPFRSVATHIVRSAGLAGRRAFDLSVLRPPTFQRLRQALEEARDAGRAFHVVHFDGHGTWEDPQARHRGTLPLRPRGYVIFEDPEANGRLLVDGRSFGRTLARAGVPLLVLNACRSAYAEPRRSPVHVEAPSEDRARVPERRAWGSLAQDAIDAGVAGVVAMRYIVYVETAAQLVADLYGALARGHSLAEAVTLARRKLHAEPMRRVGVEVRSFQDWPVPVIYEVASPGRKAGVEAVRSTRLETGESSPESDLPPTPAAGFHGRDETLLALDRAFDRHGVVLLYGEAGSGKTTAAAELVRWYVATGGLGDPDAASSRVLFTSFERPRSLRTVLGQLEPLLPEGSVRWPALSDDERRRSALDLLRRVRVLWIWDNVETVTGTPGAASPGLDPAEAERLAAFLKEAAATSARILLTSRRDESAWLEEWPHRVAMPPLRLPERLRLAQDVARKSGRLSGDMEASSWRPVLEFSAGNPLTLTVLATQAAREAVASAEELARMVDRVRQGEDAFAGDRSLQASLGYSLEHGFSADDLRRLALLHLFQGVVEVKVLLEMGISGHPWHLSAVRDLSRDTWTKLLDRLAEMGWLTELEDGTYRIHPVVPGFLKKQFEACYGDSKEGAVRAFVEAMDLLGNVYHDGADDGDRRLLKLLRREEANLLEARRLARRYGWPEAVVGTMQGLSELYDHAGRLAEWKDLVEEIVPEFVDPASDGPLPGREGVGWSIVNGYRIGLARDERRWDEMERLLLLALEQERRDAEAVLEKPRPWSLKEWATVQRRTSALSNLARLRQAREDPSCLELFTEDYRLCLRIDHTAGAAIAAFNLGNAHLELDEIDQAERWHRRSLELVEPQDFLARAQSTGQLADVALQRFHESQERGASQEELREHLESALRLYHESLDLLPHDMPEPRAINHSQLGTIYSVAGKFEEARRHFREAIQEDERAGNVHGASAGRLNLALSLRDSGRLGDALEYARAAQRGFESLGTSAVQEVARVGHLIRAIEEKFAKSAG